MANLSHIREHAEIGKNCNIGKSVYVDTEVKIGDNVKIQNFVSISVVGKVKYIITLPICFLHVIIDRSEVIPHPQE